VREECRQPKNSLLFSLSRSLIFSDVICILAKEQADCPPLVQKKINSNKFWKNISSDICSFFSPKTQPIIKQVINKGNSNLHGICFCSLTPQ